MRKKIFLSYLMLAVLIFTATVPAISAYADDTSPYNFSIAKPLVFDPEAGTVKYNDGTALTGDEAKHVYVQNGVLYLDDVSISIKSGEEGSFPFMIGVNSASGKEAVFVVKGDSSIFAAKGVQSGFTAIDADGCGVIFLGPGQLRIYSTDAATQLCKVKANTVSVVGKVKVMLTQPYAASAAGSVMDVKDVNGVPSDTSICRLRGYTQGEMTFSDIDTYAATEFTYTQAGTYEYKTFLLTAAAGQNSGSVTEAGSTISCIQYYNYMKSGSDYTDVTSVDYAWSVPDIELRSGATKKWNPEKLEWDSVSDAIEIVSQKDATVKLTNNSSVPVVAKASFAPEQLYETVIKSVTFDKNNFTIGSVVDQSTHAVDRTKAHESTITATLGLQNLNLLSYGVHKLLGTFTVTIE